MRMNEDERRHSEEYRYHYSVRRSGLWGKKKYCMLVSTPHILMRLDKVMLKSERSDVASIIVLWKVL